MATKLNGSKLVRDVEVELGAAWLPRRWPAERSTYRVEITSAGLRVRHARGAWFTTPWADVLVNSVAEETGARASATDAVEATYDAARETAGES